MHLAPATVRWIVASTMPDPCVHVSSYIYAVSQNYRSIRLVMVRIENIGIFLSKEYAIDIALLS